MPNPFIILTNEEEGKINKHGNPTKNAWITLDEPGLGYVDHVWARCLVPHPSLP